MSVLESLRLHLSSFTLSNVLTEVKRWAETGQSCFAILLAQLQLPPPDESFLDRLFPGTAESG